MLIEFALTNLKSVGETQVLSLEPSNGYRALETHHFETNSPEAGRILPVACILGANGSGKSTFIDALSGVLNFLKTESSFTVKDLHKKIGGYLPHAFDSERTPYCHIHLKFIVGSNTYFYECLTLGEIVVQETLQIKHNKKRSRWNTVFSRKPVEEFEKYEWSGNAGKKDQKVLQRIFETTEPSTLFMKVCLSLGFEKTNPIKIWARNTDALSHGDLQSLWNAGVQRSKNDPSFKEFLHRFVNDAGNDIDEIKVSKPIMPDIPEGIPEEILGFRRQSKDGNIMEFGITSESDGTKALVEYAEPLYDALSHGAVLVADELHDLLHPGAFRYIVELFCSPLSNPNGAQLIFSSHDPSILQADFLSKDEIWLIEKIDRQSILTSLSEFEDIKAKNLEAAYLSGRYGAIPIPGPLPSIEPIAMEWEVQNGAKT